MLGDLGDLFGVLRHVRLSADASLFSMVLSVFQVRLATEERSFVKILAARVGESPASSHLRSSSATGGDAQHEGLPSRIRSSCYEPHHDGSTSHITGNSNVE